MPVGPKEGNGWAGLNVLQAQPWQEQAAPSHDTAGLRMLDPTSTRSLSRPPHCSLATPLATCRPTTPSCSVAPTRVRVKAVQIAVRVCGGRATAATAAHNCIATKAGSSGSVPHCSALCRTESDGSTLGQ